MVLGLGLFFCLTGLEGVEAVVSFGVGVRGSLPWPLLDA